MKKFRWILLSGLLVAASSVAQAQTPGQPGVPGQAGQPGQSGAPAAAGNVDAGGISNVPVASTATGVTDGAFIEPDDAAAGEFSDSSSSSIPDTGGSPMIAVLAGLSIAGAAVAMRRKVSA